MDFKEILAAAQQLLAKDAGNKLKFQMSIAQIDAKAKWKTMSPEEKTPYEEKAQQRRSERGGRGAQGEVPLPRPLAALAALATAFPSPC